MAVCLCFAAMPCDGAAEAEAGTQPSWPQPAASYDLRRVTQFQASDRPDIWPVARGDKTEYARSLAMAAVIYGLPSVLQYEEMYRQAVDAKSDRYVGFNRFVHDRQLAAPGYRPFKTPNVDTLYSNAWLDLTNGPVLIDIPVFGRRYYTLNFLDMYSNASNLSLRTVGPNGGRFLIVTPAWSGQIPEGVQVFRVATPYVWILMRIFFHDPSELGVVHGLQDKVTIRPLTAGGARLPPPRRPAFPAPDMTDPRGFFTVLDFVMRANGHPVQEDALIHALGTLGLDDREPFDPKRFDRETMMAVSRGYADAMQAIRTSRAELGRPLPTHWRVANSGAYGFDYLRRAVTNYVGLGGNVSEEDQAFTTFQDASGVQLDGGKASYRWRLPAPPPEDGFWSLTLYEADSRELYRNVAGRYTLGDRSKGLELERDGSVTITISHAAPADRSNWLPAPAGPFYLALRNYLPRKELLAGKWKPEAVEAETRSVAH